MTQYTGNAVWDAVGSIGIGLLLGVIATFLVSKNRQLLLGRSMNPREIEVSGSREVGGVRLVKTPAPIRMFKGSSSSKSSSFSLLQDVQGLLRQDPVVSYILDTKTEEIGPGIYRFKAEVSLNKPCGNAESGLEAMAECT